MKNQLKKNLLYFLLLSVYILIPTKLEAQNAVNCPNYYIYNHRNCAVTVHYQVSDCLGGGCGGSGVVCSNAALVIPANTQITLPCCVVNPVPYTPSAGCPWLGGDVFVWLTHIAGKVVNGGSSSQAVSTGNCWGNPFSGGGPVPSSVAPPCNSPGVYVLTASSNGVDIY
jgi:hypothetical protein